MKPSALMHQAPNIGRIVLGPTLENRSQQCRAKVLGGMHRTIAARRDNSKMARPKSSQHEIRRDEILDMAARCFAQRSYPATSMKDVAAAGGMSKARLYHYYDSKEAILFDLLDRYTQRLLAVIGQAQATAQRRDLDERAALHELIRCFLAEYENSATRHVALLNDTRFLGEQQRELILDRQRDVVSAVTRFLKRSYPARFTPGNQTALTMMVFGMINWTFTWLRPEGEMSYRAFAEEVIAVLDRGLGP
ncbi:MAG: TetR/AcrR family transcriptional regulator [Ramlibacter sp.]